jgi:hypothetical protein
MRHDNAHPDPRSLNDAIAELDRATPPLVRAMARFDRARLTVAELAVDAKGESRHEILRVMANLKTLRAGVRNLFTDRPGAVGRFAYVDYLESPGWQLTRKEALTRADFKCQRCGASDTELNVHHLTYERLGEELPSDLVVLCRRCHQREHGIGGAAVPA